MNITAKTLAALAAVSMLALPPASALAAGSSAARLLSLTGAQSTGNVPIEFEGQQCVYGADGQYNAGSRNCSKVPEYKAQDGTQRDCMWFPNADGQGGEFKWPRQKDGAGAIEWRKCDAGTAAGQTGGNLGLIIAGIAVLGGLGAGLGGGGGNGGGPASP